MHTGIEIEGNGGKIGILLHSYNSIVLYGIYLTAAVK